MIKEQFYIKWTYYRQLGKLRSKIYTEISKYPSSDPLLIVIFPEDFPHDFVRRIRYDLRGFSHFYTLEMTKNGHFGLFLTYNNLTELSWKSQKNLNVGKSRKVVTRRNIRKDILYISHIFGMILKGFWGLKG